MQQLSAPPIAQRFNKIQFAKMVRGCCHKMVRKGLDDHAGSRPPSRRRVHDKKTEAAADAAATFKKYKFKFADFDSAASRPGRGLSPPARPRRGLELPA